MSIEHLPAPSGFVADWTWPAEHAVGPGLDGAVATLTRLARYDRLAREVTVCGRPIAAWSADGDLGALVRAWLSTACGDDVASDRETDRRFAFVDGAASPVPSSRGARAVDRLRTILGAVPDMGRPPTSEALADVVGRILSALAAANRVESPLGDTLADRFVSAAGGRSDGSADALLALWIDDALTPDTFAALVVGSCLSGLGAVLSAFVSAASGGRAIGGAATLAGWIEADDDSVTEAVRRLDRVPGFGHRLFAVGDPRTAVALDVLRRSGRVDALAAIDRIAHLSSATLTSERRHAPITNPLLPLAVWCHHVGADPVSLLVAVRAIGVLGRWAELVRDNRLFRPLDTYAGPSARTLTDDEREAWT